MVREVVGTGLGVSGLEGLGCVVEKTQVDSSESSTSKR